MGSDHADPLRSHIRLCVAVFVALLVLTGVTVAARSLPVGVAASVAVALSIATIKGSLVGAYFMHLASERRAIYALVVFTGVIVAIMMGLLVCSAGDGFEGMGPSPLQPAVQAPAAGGH